MLSFETLLHMKIIQNIVRYTLSALFEFLNVYRKIILLFAPEAHNIFDIFKNSLTSTVYAVIINRSDWIHFFWLQFL